MFLADLSLGHVAVLYELNFCAESCNISVHMGGTDDVRHGRQSEQCLMLQWPDFISHIYSIFLF